MKNPKYPGLTFHPWPLNDPAYNKFKPKEEHVREYPEYLEAPDNEDSEEVCEYCGDDAWDDGMYDRMCYACHMEAYEEEAAERAAEARAEREFDDYAIDYDPYGSDY